MNRAGFIPDVIWVHRDDSGWMFPIDRADDPETWSKLVNSGDPIVIQVDDGELEDGKGTFPTSSSSGLRVMKKMLDLLDVHEGMNILEIGTGTGYNAALMAEEAAPGHVTTIEVDPSIADQVGHLDIWPAGQPGRGYRRLPTSRPLVRRRMRGWLATRHA
jgi:hypothetical protein